MNGIVSAYRLQAFKDFPFERAEAILPYLKKLGISTLYLSPITKAREGSNHGYDVVDPTQVNPELGGRDGFERLYQAAKELGLNILVDIVPNHMAVSLENPWWMDILEHGPSSPYAHFFDIDWNPAFGPVENRVLLPVLGMPFGEAIENGELSVIFEAGSFWLEYSGNRLPIEPKSYGAILNKDLTSFKDRSQPDPGAFKELMSILDTLEELPLHTDKAQTAIQKRRALTAEVKQRLSSLHETSQAFQGFLQEGLERLSGTKNDPESFLELESLLLKQPYQLVFWQAGLKEINFRRFFDVNELVGVCVEKEDVLVATHALIFDLAAQGKIAGVRIDHIDGLFDPEGYLKSLVSGLQARGNPCPIVVEKILARGEWLPESWLVRGTTGYDFLNATTRLFVDPEGKQALEGLNADLNPKSLPFRQVVQKSKRLVIGASFQSEVTALWYRLSILAKAYRYALDLPLRELRKLLEEVSAELDVYRTYVRDPNPSKEDKERIFEAIERAKGLNKTLEERGFRFLGDLLTLQIPKHLEESFGKDWLAFVMNWQQFSSPVMAKGYEDTALYNYPRLVSLNEVGGDPERFGDDPRAFHAFIQDRGKSAPGSLSASSTHDTKRSEDVRARISVLSELPSEFRRHVKAWRRLLAPARTRVGRESYPDPNAELLFYQTLLGAWPLDKSELEGLPDRMAAYMLKTAKEAKAKTSWIEPNEAYERALEAFVRNALDQKTSEGFLKAFLGFQPAVAFYGALNGLSQATLKLMAPGVPDTYQGTELWDFSLVDPDNRRPVDYCKRKTMLDGLQVRAAKGLDELLRDLLASWEDGRVKLYVTWRLLTLRQENPDLFLEGDYLPLEVVGKKKDHAVAFQRRLKDRSAIVVIPRLTSVLTKPGIFPLGKAVWEKTTLEMPKDSPKRFRSVFADQDIESSQGKLPLANVFSGFPIGVFLGNEAKEEERA